MTTGFLFELYLLTSFGLYCFLMGMRRSDEINGYYAPEWYQLLLVSLFWLPLVVMLLVGVVYDWFKEKVFS